MKKCHNCDTDNSDEAFYCKNCGANIEKSQLDYQNNINLQIEAKKRKKLKNKKFKDNSIVGVICLGPIVMIILISFFLSQRNSTVTGLLLLISVLGIFFMIAYLESKRKY